jgi:hypothetical protein
MKWKRAELIGVGLVIGLPLLTGCVTSPEVDDARVKEQRAEQVLEDAEALPASAPGKAALVAEARATERELERIRQALEALDRDSLIGSAIEVGSRGARGDYIGIVEVLGGLATAAGTYLLARRKGATEIERQLADLERRRDQSRAAQGIAAASERSAIQSTSPVALAAKDIQERVAQQVAQKSAYDAARAQAFAAMEDQGIPTWSAPIAPVSRAEATSEDIDKALRKAFGSAASN